MKPIKILHTNDLHGNLHGTCFEQIRSLRAGADLYFDTGDVIKAGNLAVPLREDQAWQRLDELDCTASALGNRETHILEGAFLKKLEGARHPILCANLRRRGFVPEAPHPKLEAVQSDTASALQARDPSAEAQMVFQQPGGTSFAQRCMILDLGGLRIGVFGIMVPMVTASMKTQKASAFLWDQPIPTAIEVARELRPAVHLLIALTHIGHRRDLELAEQCQELDIIFGGHSHTRLELPDTVGRTSICQGGSHCHHVGFYDWIPDKLSGGLISTSIE